MILYSKPWGKDIDSGLRLEVVTRYTIAKTYANKKYVATCQTENAQNCDFYAHVKDLKCLRIMKGRDVVLRALLWTALNAISKKPFVVLDRVYTSNYGGYGNDFYEHCQDLERAVSGRLPFKVDFSGPEYEGPNALVPLLPSANNYIKKVDKYPCIDTFCILTYDFKYLTNDEDVYEPPYSWWLTQTDGKKEEMSRW